MGLPATNPRLVQFGLYELDLDARELRKSGVRIKLQDQPFQILEALLERPGAVVTREELQKKLWPADTFVDFDLSLNSAVKKLRQALNDDSENPRFIETLYRRGYRFIAPVNGNANGDLVQLVENRSDLRLTPTISIPTEPKPSTGHRHSFLYIAIPVLLLLAGGTAYKFVTSRQPAILGYTQITHDGLFKGSPATDGQRIYFTELQGDHFVISQVSVAGGETSVVPTPFQNAMAGGVASDGSALLVGTFHGTDKNVEMWSVPLPSGTPRRLGDLLVDSAAWSPDGTRLAYSRGPDIYLAKSDGTEQKKIASVGSRVSGLGFSPEGNRLRFDVVDQRFDAVDQRNGSSAIWEIRLDGTGLRPLLPAWNPAQGECCGNWTPDGKYFLFQSFRNGRSGIWALAEHSPWFGARRQPVQLTNGPLDFFWPIASKDDNRIFAIGRQPRSEIVRYDGKSGFVPILDGISASDLAFSADGKWVAYVTVPERQLWRSRVDGSERAQLTFGQMESGLPRWSPDGKQIVFMADDLKTGWHAYLISSDGSGIRELIPDAEAGYDPSWSPDGKSIVLTLNAAGGPALIPGGGIVTVDVASGKVSPLSDAKQFFSPRWSPDGRYIAAITTDSSKLMLFDRTTQRWQELVNMPIGYPSWFHDGQYLYFDTTFVSDANFFRIRISDHKVEKLVSLKGLRQYWGDFGSWTGLAPDDSLLLVRDIGSQEIYAIDWQP